MSAERCGTCRYWLTGQASPIAGDCRRYPSWVRRAFGDWCGEWSRRPDVPKKPVKVIMTEKGEQWR